MSRFFVTGAQGFVGRFVVAELLRTGQSSVMGIGRSPEASGQFTHSVTRENKLVPAPLPKEMPPDLFNSSNYSYRSIDLQNQAELKRALTEFQPDFIIHLASGLFGDSVEKLFRCNVEGTANLLRAIPNNGGVARIVIGSSGGVYGNSVRLPLCESDCARPIHMYSVSKLAAEMVARVVALERNLPLVVARIFNIVGPGQDERHACGRWMQQLVSHRDAGRFALRVGSLVPTRDFVDVRDTASACIRLSYEGVTGEIYNVASGVETRMRDVLEACIDAAGMAGKIDIEETLDRPVDIPRHFADVRKIKTLGWQPKYGVAESLLELAQYYRCDVGGL